MPTSRSESLTRLCRTRLKRALDRPDSPTLLCSFEQAVCEIADIVSQNLPERFDHYNSLREGKKKLTLTQYVDRVVEQWLIDAPRVHRLNAGEANEWTRLRDDLRRVTANRLAHSTHIHSSMMTAADFADRACERLLETRYPFDVSFDAWARAILRNLVFEPGRSSDVLDQPHISFDQPIERTNADSETLVEILPDLDAEGILRTIEDREELMQLVQRLRSPAQQAVIVMKYFQNLEDAEIARRLTKTKSNVQTLRHRALRRLSQLIGAHQVKETQHRKHQKK